MKKLPTKLDKQTVLDAISEIVFEEAKDIAVLFSDLYSILKADDWEFEKLPVMNLPENIRNGNRSFEKTPHYVFLKDGKKVFIGPSIMAFTYGTTKAYSGWSDYKEDLSEFYNLLKNVNDETNIAEVSLNFMDFFKGLNIFENVTISVDDAIIQGIYRDEGASKKYSIDLSSDGLNIAIKIENEISLEIKGTESKVEGSVIDIHIFKSVNNENIMDVFDIMHRHAKEIFFTLLKDDFIKTLKPTYKE